MASVEKRRTAAGDVRWYARYRDPDGTSRSRAFDRKGDAERHLVEVRHSMFVGAYVDPAARKITVGAYYADWCARQSLRPGTIGQHELTQRRIAERLGRIPISALRRPHVESWIKEQLQTYAPQTVTNDIGRLRQVLKAAIVDGVLVRDPTTGIKAPSNDKPPMSIPTTGEVAGIIGAFDPDLRIAPMLMATAGLRIGEACGLAAEHVDFMRRTVRIEQQVQQRPNQPLGLYPLKTRSSYRVIPIPDETLQVIAEHLRFRPASGSTLLLRRADGDPVAPNFMHHAFVRAVKTSEVGSWTPHSLRHYYASALIAGGESVRTVQARLGHASAAITLNIYAHLWPESDEVTRRIVGAIASELVCTGRVFRDAVDT
jgi:integrase